MDIRRLTREQIERAIEDGLRWAHTHDYRGGEGEVMPAAAVAVLVLADGRAVARQALQNARAQIAYTGSDADEVHQSVLAGIDYALGRLDAPRTLDPETLAKPDRVDVIARALDLADAVVDGIDESCRPENYTDLQTLAVAFDLVTERLAHMATVPHGSRCSWCLVAAGGTRAAWNSLPARSRADMAQHVVECEHSPGAAAMRALGALRSTLARRGAGDHLFADGLTLSQWVARRLVECENLRLAATGGQVHEADCPDPLSPHATCLDDGDRRAAPRTDAATGEPIVTFQGQRLVGMESPPPGQITVRRVSECARCGEVHDELTATAFERPVDVPEAGGVLWTHWATCPTTGDPILVATSDAPLPRLTDDVVEGLKRFADVADTEGQICLEETSCDVHRAELAAAAWLESRGWRRDG